MEYDTKVLRTFNSDVVRRLTYKYKK